MTIDININEADKELFSSLCDSYNITMEDAFRLFVKTSVLNNALPFSLIDCDDDGELNERNDIWL